MLKTIASLLTKENITFALSLFSAMCVILGWLHSYFITRKKFALHVVAYTALYNNAWFYIAFENKSRLPISISTISILIDGTYYPCRYIPQVVREKEHYTGSKTEIKEQQFSIPFPINLSSLGSNSGFVLFVFPTGISMPTSKNVTFQVSSNRGKAIQMTLPLDQTLDTL